MCSLAKLFSGGHGKKAHRSGLGHGHGNGRGSEYGHGSINGPGSEYGHGNINEHGSEYEPGNINGHGSEYGHGNVNEHGYGYLHGHGNQNKHGNGYGYVHGHGYPDRRVAAQTPGLTLGSTFAKTTALELEYCWRDSGAALDNDSEPKDSPDSANNAADHSCAVQEDPGIEWHPFPQTLCDDLRQTSRDLECEGNPPAQDDSGDEANHLEKSLQSRLENIDKKISMALSKLNVDDMPSATLSLDCCTANDMIHALAHLKTASQDWTAAFQQGYQLYHSSIKSSNGVETKILQQGITIARLLECIRLRMSTGMYGAQDEMFSCRDSVLSMLLLIPREVLPEDIWELLSRFENCPSMAQQAPDVDMPSTSWQVVEQRNGGLDEEAGGVGHGFTEDYDLGSTGADTRELHDEVGIHDMGVFGTEAESRIDSKYRKQHILDQEFQNLHIDIDEDAIVGAIGENGVISAPKSSIGMRDSNQQVQHDDKPPPTSGENPAEEKILKFVKEKSRTKWKGKKDLECSVSQEEYEVSGPSLEKGEAAHLIANINLRPYLNADQLRNCDFSKLYKDAGVVRYINLSLFFCHS